MLRQLPISENPDLLVGFETSDDAGVFRLPGGQALVQTIDFFTPIVDDPYAYGSIAAANALSDVYAMGGRPLTVLNVACFDPGAAPAEVWAQVFKGAADKTHESGAVIVGGHSILDSEPKFGMAVTGLVDQERVFANTGAKMGDRLFLTKPLGTGIITTAAKCDAADTEQLTAAIESMGKLNKDAMELGQAFSVRCATDITGFGLAGHLFNIAKASGVGIQIQSSELPLFPGLERLVGEGHTTGAAERNREHLGEALSFESSVPLWLQEVVVDPQTSGGLVLFSRETLEGAVEIGRVVVGPAGVEVF